MLHWYYAGTKLLHCYIAGDTLVPHWRCRGNALVLSRYCNGVGRLVSELALNWHCNTTNLRQWYCTGAAQLPNWYRTGVAKVLFRCGARTTMVRLGHYNISAQVLQYSGASARQWSYTTTGTALALHSSRAGPVLVLHWCFTGTDPALRWNFTGATLVASWSSAGARHSTRAAQVLY